MDRPPIEVRRRLVFGVDPPPPEWPPDEPVEDDERPDPPDPNDPPTDEFF